MTTGAVSVRIAQLDTSPHSPTSDGNPVQPNRPVFLDTSPEHVLPAQRPAHQRRSLRTPQGLYTPSTDFNDGEGIATGRTSTWGPTPPYPTAVMASSAAGRGLTRLETRPKRAVHYRSRPLPAGIALTGVCYCAFYDKGAVAMGEVPSGARHSGRVRCGPRRASCLMGTKHPPHRVCRLSTATIRAVSAALRVWAGVGGRVQV